LAAPFSYYQDTRFPASRGYDFARLLRCDFMRFLRYEINGPYTG
jgi:hypothetical protein